MRKRLLFLFLVLPGVLQAQEAAVSLQSSVAAAVDKVKPALVRIHVVETDYSEGREIKYEISGSGAVIDASGFVITNHHVAGHAKQLKCVFSNKQEVPAVLVGGDPLTDIAVIKLQPESPQTYPVATFGDSDAMQAGDPVMAMGSPLSISQSVTLGIVSNTEMILPSWMNRWGGMQQDGEDVGGLVKWIAHDAEIHGGNSGGPLVNMQGEIIGINEIKMGLAGAIPGNLAKHVAQKLIEFGHVPRAWLGLEVQSRLKHHDMERGVLVSSILKDSPAAKAGLKSGDIVLKINDLEVDLQFQEQLPALNFVLSELPVGQPARFLVLRGAQEQTMEVTPEEREKRESKQHEVKEWGLTVRDISMLQAKELKRDSTDGVLVTTVRPGGAAGAAKPEIREKDILVEVGGTRVKNVEELRAATATITANATEPVATLAVFERKTEHYLTVVKVGVSDLKDPGLEVKKAWLPVETQVITRDIAGLLKDDALTGFRITQIYEGSTAEKAGLKVGDLITAVDGEALTASAPEHYEELQTFVRQYRVGDSAELVVLRGAETLKVPVALERAPMLEREMKKYRNDDFEFTVRDITFFDRAKERWQEEQTGVLVDEVKPGSWASLGELSVGDLLLQINDQDMTTVEEVRAAMERIAAEKSSFVILKVMRGIHQRFIELEPKWES
ncbi:MAG: PDZ domain-containing protein [Candidatus Hydrogenedentes bacterium]|nr:PDZ domain-containing protein [Candidatus Hydrogenedentota bacterium]